MRDLESRDIEGAAHLARFEDDGWFGADCDADYHRAFDNGEPMDEAFYPEWDGPTGYFDLPQVEWSSFRFLSFDHHETIWNALAAFRPDYDDTDIPF